MPHSYLLNELTSDFESLTQKAVQESVKKNGANARPDRTAQELVRFWSLSIWKLMEDLHRLDPDLMDQIVEHYFQFMFALGFQTTEIIHNAGQQITSLDAWRDLFLEEFSDAMKSPRGGYFNNLHRVFKSLDWGKTFVYEGYDWLKTTKKIHPNFFPTSTL